MEQQAYGLLCLILAFKFVKKESLDGFLMNAFVYIKVVQSWLLYNMDWRLLCCFWMMYTVTFAITRPPQYDGPRSYDKPFVASYFQEAVLGDKAGSWLVLFHASWSKDSLTVAPVFAELSTQFATPTFQFGEVMIDDWPGVAERMKISDRAWDGQVPSIIRFENGKEVGRMPSGKQAVLGGKATFRRVDIISSFSLEEKAGTGATKTTAKVQQSSKQSAKKK